MSLTWIPTDLLQRRKAGALLAWLENRNLPKPSLLDIEAARKERGIK